jgi:hypothetical protein
MHSIIKGPDSERAISPPQFITPEGKVHSTNARPTVQAPDPASFRLAGHVHCPSACVEPSAQEPPLSPSVPELVADGALGFEDMQATSVAGMATPPTSEATIRIIPVTSRACHFRRRRPPVA